MLKVKDLSVGYGKRQILNNINLNINKGEVFGIIGPNGSGKTTLVKTITKVLRQTTGEVFINDKNIMDMKSTEIAKHIGVVSQVISINFEFTVEDIVLMGRTPYMKGGESAEDLDIVKEAMKKTNTYFLRERYVTQLSGGELQRVIIARALAQQPDILLLDEPTSHLDITNQIEILNLVKKESKKGMLVIAVVHDLNLAAYYCDKLALIRDGTLRSFGTPAEVLTPKNIQDVYNLSVEIITNKITNSLYVIPKLEPLPDI